AGSGLRRRGPEASGRALAGPRRHDLSVAWRGGGHEAREQLLRRLRHLLDSGLEDCLVRVRGLRVAAHLAPVPDPGRPALPRSGRRLEVVERSDVAAHAARLAVAPSWEWDDHPITQTTNGGDLPQIPLSAYSPGAPNPCP